MSLQHTFIFCSKKKCKKWIQDKKESTHPYCHTEELVTVGYGSTPEPGSPQAAWNKCIRSMIWSGEIVSKVTKAAARVSMLRCGQYPQALLCLWVFFFLFFQWHLQWHRLQSRMHVDTVFFNQTCELWDLHLDRTLSAVSHSRAWCHCRGRETLAAAHRDLRAVKLPRLLLKELRLYLQKSTEIHRPPHLQPPLLRHKLRTCQTAKNTQENLTPMGRMGTVGPVQSGRKASPHILPEGLQLTVGGGNDCVVA